MTHRAETILEAVQTSLTGLNTTAARVQRARIWPVEQCPALSIEKGEELPMQNGRSLAHLDRQLEIVVTAYVKANLSNPETALNQIAAEVYTALFTDVTQGLNFVIDTIWQGDARPDFSSETDSRSAIMRMTYVVQYRHSINSPES